MHFLEAALKILKEADEPPTEEEITKRALKQRLIETTEETPEATMSSKIYVDIKKNGSRSLFVNMGSGKFGLTKFDQHDIFNNEIESDLERVGTFKTAAIRVLEEAGEPLKVQEITNLALKRGYLETKRKTPPATMRVQIHRDLDKLGYR